MNPATLSAEFAFVGQGHRLYLWDFAYCGWLWDATGHAWPGAGC